MRRIINSSKKVIAMTEISREVLTNIYDCPPEKIVVICHGVPDFEYGKSKQYQTKLKIAEANPMLLSAGLLGPGKGLEYIIDAMPKIIKVAPKAKLYIVGQTHPVILKNKGEAYRNKLIKLVEDKKLGESVKFINRYLSDKDLYDYFQAADYFLTAYANIQQSASGTLAWALGAGKICLSTPYQYAKELLSNGSGILIKPEDSASIADGIISTYRDTKKAKSIHELAYKKGHQFIWPNIAKNYADLFESLIDNK
jgi:glycosyltransferase involved in cell wall biosynthesis